MPDISDLDSLKKQLIVVLLGFGDQGLTRKAGLHRRNFIRLVDKAIYEYEEARKLLLADVREEERQAAGKAAGGWIIYGFGFTDHLENCISATRRLLRIVEKLKSDGKTALIPRETRHLLESISKEIIDVRDVVEHMDEMVQNDKIKENMPVILSLSRERRDKVSIGGYSLELARLGQTLKVLHRVGIALLDLSPKSWP